MSGWPWRDVDLAWTAGFIEGEGTIQMYIRYRSQTDMWYPEPRIQANNTEKPLIILLHKMFGGSICLGTKKGKRIGKYVSKKDCWRWQVSNLQAYHVAKALIPFLRGHFKKAAEVIIEYYEKRPERIKSTGGIFLYDLDRRKYNKEFAERQGVVGKFINIERRWEP